MKCFFGEHYVDPEAPDTHVQITAWVSGPKKDGATLRETTENLACGKCIAARRLGQDPSQLDLFAVQQELPKPVINQSAPMYKIGWKAGFFNTGYNPDWSKNPNYLGGYAAGQQMKDFLDGYFFFQEMP